MACAQGHLGEGPSGRDPGPDGGSDPIDDPDDDGPVNPTDDDPPPLPDADAGMPPENCTPTAINLLTNPNFDDGPDAGWLQNDTGGVTLVVTNAETNAPVQTPDHAAWLGGINNSVHAVMQPITLPTDATGFVIRGYRNILSQDNDADADKLRVRLTDTQFNVLELLSDPNVPCPDCTYSNTSGRTNGTYQAFTLTPTGNYAGQTIYLHIQSNLDGGLLSDFIFDTMNAEVQACPPAP